MMSVRVNGRVEDFDRGATLADAVAAAGAASEPRGVAAALDGEVVPRDQWASRPLAEGQEVEVVRAVQGG